MCERLEKLLTQTESETIKSQLVSLYSAYNKVEDGYRLFFNEREWDSLVANILEGKMTESKKIEYNLKF
jgi:DnaJ-domain-containing protein 1